MSIRLTNDHKFIWYSNKLASKVLAAFEDGFSSGELTECDCAKIVKVGKRYAITINM